MKMKRELRVAHSGDDEEMQGHDHQKRDHEPLLEALFSPEMKKDPCWVATAKSRVYAVPLAEHWNSLVGTDIKDDCNDMVFRILREERIGRFKTGDPIFRVMIGATDNRVLAVVQREMKNLKDRYVVYGLTANGNDSVPYHDAKHGQKRFDMYPVVEIVQSVLGGKYVIKSPGSDGEILFKATNGHIRTALICCGPCLMLGAFPFKFSFRTRGQEPREVVFFRDQKTQVMELSAGNSPLLGICIAYAVDRLTRPVL